MKVFVAGGSGVGKSTVAGELNNRGFNTIDVDHVPGLCSWVNKETREKVNSSNIDSIDDDFMEQHNYECDIEMLKSMLGESDDLIFVFGNVGDNSLLLPFFEKVFLLQCLPETRLERLKTRATNSFGKNKTVHQRILDWTKILDKLMLDAGAIPISTEGAIEEVVDKIIDEVKT